MKKMPAILTGTLICLSLFAFGGLHSSLAEDISSIGIATYMPVAGDVEDGDVVSSTEKGYFKSEKAYDPQVVGVVTSKPAISLKVDSQKKGVPVVNVGTVVVKVTGTNDKIRKGAFITTSSKPGVAMKATRSGYIIGQA